MTELEKAGKWIFMFKQSLPFYAIKGLPQESVGFVYKVLKNWETCAMAVKLNSPRIVMETNSFNWSLTSVIMSWFVQFRQEIGERGINIGTFQGESPNVYYNGSSFTLLREKIFSSQDYWSSVINNLCKRESLLFRLNQFTTIMLL